MKGTKEVALTICEKFQDEYPKKPIYEMILEVEVLINNHVKSSIKDSWCFAKKQEPIDIKNLLTTESRKHSFLYKPIEDQTVSTEIKQEKRKVIIDFYSDCGKHGTNELLSVFILTPDRLMTILSEREDITEDEI